MTDTSNAEQSEFWNSQPGQNWVVHQADLDLIHEDITAVLLEACAAQPGERVLDIGCGAGASSFRLASTVGPRGMVLGIDISVPLIRRAEERNSGTGIDNLAFEVADAQDHRFEKQAFDLVASRFGVMFFSEPVAAFRNIARALRPGGRIVFVAWAGPEANPWFTLPQRIAVERLGPVAPSQPDAPGPMAFQDIGRVCGILQDASFSDCSGERLGTELHHPGGVEAVTKLASHVGPVARTLREKNGTPADHAAIAEALAAELGRFRSDDGIRIPAGVNLFRAVVAR